MSKSKEELDALKEEVEAVNEKLAELTEEELAQVNGGSQPRNYFVNNNLIQSPSKESR